MHNLNKLFKECLLDLDAIGIEYGNIVEIKVNTRAKSRWGQCKLLNYEYTEYWEEYEYSINISDRLLNDNVKVERVKDTIIHEILHTCEGCMNHGEQWKRLADLVNDCYSCYNIKRTTSSEEKGIEYIPKKYKYTLICNECNRKYKYNRMCKALKYIADGNVGGRYKCKCGCRKFCVRENF